MSERFDFDEVVDRRGTSSTKHEKFGADVLPLWVADMDFRSPRVVLEALKSRIDHGVLGYTDTPPELIEVIQARLRQRYDWEVSAEELVFIPGVVTGLNLACRALCGPDDAVMTSVPIYQPFMTAPAFSGRRLIRVPARREEGCWRLDIDGLEAAAKAGARLLLLCNPHNPLGRVLTPEELESVASLCERYNVIICSDEIHCDLLFDGRCHTPMATLSSTVAERTVTFLAPSKTFNLAGLGGAFAVIRNSALREALLEAQQGIVPHTSFAAYTAMIAAYRQGEPWRLALIDYLQGNRDFLAAYFGRREAIDMTPVEATYLAWLDVSSLKLDDPAAFFESFGLGMSAGDDFGDGRFMRLNFGCSRLVLEEAVRRFDRALNMTQT